MSCPIRQRRADRAAPLELLRRNDARTDTYIRPLVFVSAEVIGVRLHDMEQSFLIYTAPLGEYIDTDGGIRCMTSTWRRISDSAIPARAKITGSYVNSALAKSEALENGYDEAIMLTTDGHVSEGSAENLFMLRDGVFITPPVTEDILEGITRNAADGPDPRRARTTRSSSAASTAPSCTPATSCCCAAPVRRSRRWSSWTIAWSATGGSDARRVSLQDLYFRAVRGEEAALSRLADARLRVDACPRRQRCSFR